MDAAAAVTENKLVDKKIISDNNYKTIIFYRNSSNIEDLGRCSYDLCIHYDD